MSKDKTHDGRAGDFERCTTQSSHSFSLSNHEPMMRCDLSLACSVSSIASRFPLTLWQPSLHADAVRVRKPKRHNEGVSPCRRMSGSTWNNSTCCTQKQGEGTEHQRAFCGSAELAKNGAGEMERIHSKHRRDDDETKQHCRRPHRH